MTARPFLLRRKNLTIPVMVCIMLLSFAPIAVVLKNNLPKNQIINDNNLVKMVPNSGSINRSHAYLSNQYISRDGMSFHSLAKPESIVNLVSNIPSAKYNVKNFKNFHLPILMYHHLRAINSSMDIIGQGLSVSPTSFENTLSELQSDGYKTVSFDELQDYMYLGKILPEKSIMLTFDDGYDDNFENAFPLLKKYGFTAQFGVITGLVGQQGYMNWDQIKALKDAGNSIVSHSVSHPNMADIDMQRLVFELRHSKEVIDSMLSQNTTVIIYPSGKYSPVVEEAAISAGYNLGRSTHYGSEISLDNVMHLPVIRMFDTTGLSAIRVIY